MLNNLRLTLILEINNPLGKQDCLSNLQSVMLQSDHYLGSLLKELNRKLSKGSKVLEERKKKKE